MAQIERIQRPVFKAPTKGRCYLSARSAANAEARAMLNKKYPPEKPEYENGRMFSPGWYWSQDARLVKVYERLTRCILKKFKQGGKV
jgi:hypothetical protein